MANEEEDKEEQGEEVENEEEENEEEEVEEGEEESEKEGEEESEEDLHHEQVAPEGGDGHHGGLARRLHPPHLGLHLLLLDHILIRLLLFLLLFFRYIFEYISPGDLHSLLIPPEPNGAIARAGHQ